MELLVFFKEHITLDVMYQTFSVLVSADVTTGMLKFWKLGRFKSRSLRDGLFGSVGELTVLLICIILSKFIPVVDVVVYPLMLFMSVKELASIVENLLVIGVKFPTWLVKGLQVYGDILDKGEEVKNDKV